ncbi:MAG: FxsA family protein [Acidiferrobacterales bacterium]|nr:FxsA family protein [Acidiferrobacterales bacterium]
MRVVTILFLCFLIIPIAEIYLLIQIGQVIGAGWTIVGVVATALIGAWLVRLQGILTLHRAVGSVKSGEVPALELVEGLFLLVAGALLITPGFVTDAIGFICLTSPIRRAFASILLSRLIVHVNQRSQSSQSRTYDVKFREIDTD